MEVGYHFQERNNTGDKVCVWSIEYKNQTLNSLAEFVGYPEKY